MATALITAIVATSPLSAGILASDTLLSPSYTLGALGGQAVNGTGFTGNWTAILGQGLTATASGIARPTVTAGNSGDTASFAAGLTFTAAVGGQFYLSYDIDNETGNALNSSRVDTNSNVGTAYLGGSGFNADFNFVTSASMGAAIAQSTVSSVGEHRLVGVLDFSNDQIAIFVDPTAGSYYNSDGTNNANAFAAWTAPTTVTFTTYSLVNNFSDQASFANVVYSSDLPSASNAAPEPSTLFLFGGSLAGLLFAKRRSFKA